MEAQLQKLFPHLESRDSQPPGGFGLVTLGKADGLREQFRFEVSDHLGIDVLLFAALRPRQEVGDVCGVCLARGHQRLRCFGQRALDMLQPDGQWSCYEESLANDVLQFSHVARP